MPDNNLGTWVLVEAVARVSCAVLVRTSAKRQLPQARDEMKNAPKQGTVLTDCPRPPIFWFPAPYLD
jgi:hypothetical protein